MASNNYKDVGFVTTKSDNVAYILKDTGNIVIMDDADGSVPQFYIDSVENPSLESGTPLVSSYIFFRGKAIAGGIGSPTFIEASKVSYVANTYQAVYDDLDERMRATYAYVEFTYNSIFSYTSYNVAYLNKRMDESVGDVEKVTYLINESVNYWNKVMGITNE